MKRSRRWLWFGLGLLALVSGCNISALPYFLAGHDPKDPPQWHQLAAKDKDKQIRVAILVASNLSVSEQLTKVDRELASKLEITLRNLCKENEENVKVLTTTTIDRYKTAHPNWDNLIDLPKIGHDLGADYVIYLEVNKMSLYVPGSTRQLYQGDMEIEMTLVNAKKGPEDIPERKQLHDRYPSTPIDASEDPNPIAFRSKLLDRVAKKIAWEFTSHPLEDTYSCDN